uniref:Uncharacterized protein n=1 Tax=Brassica oleracea TaxID=3712 RepID=A0A3P6DGL0_BRAOL|nr:unnamed protein product [Brassica oleracea]
MNRTLADFQAAQQQQAAINVILLRSVVRLTVTARRFFLISGLRRSINRIWLGSEWDTAIQILNRVGTEWYQLDALYEFNWDFKHLEEALEEEDGLLYGKKAFVNLVLALCDPVVMFQPYYSCESW